MSASREGGKIVAATDQGSGVISDFKPIPITAEVDVKIIALIHAEESGGYSAEVPALPGCHSGGATLEETLAMIREAAQGCLAVRHDIETGVICW